MLKEKFYFYPAVFIIACLISFLFLLQTAGSSALLFAQGEDLEFSIDFKANTITLPQVLTPGLDLSGRGFNKPDEWPNNLSAKEALELWEKEIGLSGIYRLQYNLWEINELAKNPSQQASLIENYDSIMKKITDAKGTVILNIFGTPAGMGKVLDKRSPPVDSAAFKELVKSQIRRLSCEKKYNIWYEVWNAPDLDDFFLGRKQDYLNIYRSIAEAVKELEGEFKIQIPLGAPSCSWWFQNFDANTILTPERSLIYELIRFCYHYHLPLDFISWHAYSTDPQAEKEITIYKNNPIQLIRKWLSYFRFSEKTKLIVDEWNYDSGSNILPARYERAYISSSYIPARLKNMQQVGLDYQTFFSLEDFENNQENVVINVGAFWFDPEASRYRGFPKSTYNVFKMFSSLDKELLPVQGAESEFVGVIGTKSENSLTLIIYNYIDPRIALNYISRNIATLGKSDRLQLVNFVNSGELAKILDGSKEIAKLRVTKTLKNILKKAKALYERGEKLSQSRRTATVNIKNLSGNFTYEKFAVNSSCTINCKFVPLEQKEIELGQNYQQKLALEPYSVYMLKFKKIPPSQEEPVKQE